MSVNKIERDQLVQDFVENYIGKVFYFCLKKTNNQSDAEDLAQDIALNIIDGLNKGTIPNNFSAWVWQIVRNVYSKWAINKRKKRENINSIDIYDIDVVDEKTSVIDDMIHDEQLTLLRRELAFIKSEYRNIIVAYYLENRSVKDIAKSLSLSVDAIHQRLHRARKILKEGMNMVRTFGKRSYSPENIAFIMNGKSGKKGQPWSIISHLLYKNIFLEVYENPETAEELSLGLGIALPYMEDELAFLTKEQLLRKNENKYETNFKIISREKQLSIHNNIIKFSDKITNKICELIDCYVDNGGKKIDFQHIGYENAKWALIVSTFDELLLTTKKFTNSPVSYKDVNHPMRPDDGTWTITGYECPIDFKKPKFVGLHGYVYQDEKEIIRDVRFGQYKFYANDLYYKTPENITHMDAYTLWLICSGKLEDCQERYVEQLIKYGYIKKENDTIVPNIVIFNYGKENIREEILYKLKTLKNEIINLIKKACSIERGYIVEQAIKNGWLKFKDNTPNTVGAFIYK